MGNEEKDLTDRAFLYTLVFVLMYNELKMDTHGDISLGAASRRRRRALYILVAVGMVVIVGMMLSGQDPKSSPVFHQLEGARRRLCQTDPSGQKQFVVGEKPKDLIVVGLVFCAYPYSFFRINASTYRRHATLTFCRWEGAIL